MGWSCRVGGSGHASSCLASRRTHIHKKDIELMTLNATAMTKWMDG